MKTKYLVLTVLAVSFFASCASQSASKKEKDALVSQQVTENVQSKKYTIEVDRALPMRGKSVYLSSGYNLSVRNDSAIAYLPYFGRAYSAPYGGGEGGIKFEDVMKEYKLTPGKKAGDWNVSFKVDVPNYNYEVSIDIFSNGSSSILVTCTQRESITFSGQMNTDPKK